jgi:undecaprenyl-diphosphatase
VLLAFVVTAIPCYLLDKKIGENLESLPVIAWALILGGVAMWVIDAMCTRPRTDDLERISPLQAMAIGAAQVIPAALPGTSRSMATIAAGQLAGLSRPAALEFSFFLSIPVMFAATLFKLAQAVLGRTHDPTRAIEMTAHRWGVLAVGFVVSFLVAWAVVAWFMGWVRKRGFAPFAVYRIVLGVAVLLALYGSRSAGG